MEALAEYLRESAELLDIPQFLRIWLSMYTDEDTHGDSSVNADGIQTRTMEELFLRLYPELYPVSPDLPDIFPPWLSNPLRLFRIWLSVYNVIDDGDTSEIESLKLGTVIGAGLGTPYSEEAVAYGASVQGDISMGEAEDKKRGMWMQKVRLQYTTMDGQTSEIDFVLPDACSNFVTEICMLVYGETLGTLVAVALSGKLDESVPVKGLLVPMPHVQSVELPDRLTGGLFINFINKHDGKECGFSNREWIKFPSLVALIKASPV